MEDRKRSFLLPKTGPAPGSGDILAGLKESLSPRGQMARARENVEAWVDFLAEAGMYEGGQEPHLAEE